MFIDSLPVATDVAASVHSMASLCVLAPLLHVFTLGLSPNSSDPGLPGLSVWQRKVGPSVFVYSLLFYF